jgi:hypothetical protein
MNKTILILIVMALLLGACTSPQPQVSESDIATKVALLKGTGNPPAVTDNNGVVVATVQTAAPQEATATATVTVTPTTQPSDPVTWLGTPTWRDTFSGTNNFYTMSDENITFSYASDAFSMTATNVNGWHSWSLGNRRIGNFYLEATFKVAGCSGSDQYGLVFRAPNTSEGYFYGISCEGKFVLIRWDSMDQLIAWKPAVPLRAGPNQTNRVGVMARGTELTLYINGEEIQKITNERYNEGLFGFYIASNNTYNFNVLVDEVAFWNQ